MRARLRSSVLVLVAAILVTAEAAISGRQAAPADTILFGGKIITVDDNDRIAQAIAVRGGRIVAVGTSQEIQALAGPSTERIDLRGRAISIAPQGTIPFI